MSRLFITERELAFVSDITKELVKDVMGSKIFFYHVREDVTKIHDVYEESLEKVFDPPIELECIVAWQPSVIRTNSFGTEEFATIEAFIHNHELMDRDISINEGDYFSYGDTFFEITSAVTDKKVFGLVEFSTGIKLTGKQARRGQIDKDPIGPTSEFYTDDEDAIQNEFVQQRGQERNRLGETGDTRRLQTSGKVDSPVGGPQEISENGEPTGPGSSFYGDC